MITAPPHGTDHFTVSLTALLVAPAFKALPTTDTRSVQVPRLKDWENAYAPAAVVFVVVTVTHREPTLRCRVTLTPARAGFAVPVNLILLLALGLVVLALTVTVKRTVAAGVADVAAHAPDEPAYRIR